MKYQDLFLDIYIWKDENIHMKSNCAYHFFLPPLT